MTKPKWPKLLVIVRHGESQHNLAEDLLQKGVGELIKKQQTIRDADIPLTKKGESQAQKTGKYLSKKPKFDICFSSPYKRTLQTSEGIISSLGYDLKIYKDNRLREKEFGRLHGMSTEDIKEKYPEEFEDRKRDGKYWYRLPRGENYPDVEDRIHGFLDKLHRSWAGKNVLVVTHQVCYKSFRTLFEHLDEENVLDLPETPNCGIQIYELDISKVKEGRMKLVGYDIVA